MQWHEVKVHPSAAKITPSRWRGGILSGPGAYDAAA